MIYIGFQDSVLTSRWFPAWFALLQSLRHLAFVGYSYWQAAENTRLDVEKLIRDDLAKPLGEAVSFSLCDALVSHDSATTALLGLDFPAYVLAGWFREVITGEPNCVHMLTTPRGQVLTAVVVAFVWFAVGMSLRRIAQKRWRAQAKWRITLLVCGFGMFLLPMALLFVLVSFIALVMASVGDSLRAAGFAFWLVLGYALCAERLRIWPFHRIDGQLALQASDRRD